jgi:hypothetical protein
VATRKKATRLAVEPELVAQLTSVEAKLSDAADALETLLMDERFEKSMAPQTRDFDWLMSGVTENLVADAKEIAKYACSLRSFARGGLTPDEIDLMEAAGGEH